MKGAEVEAHGRKAFFAEGTRSRRHDGSIIWSASIIAAPSVVNNHSPAVSDGGERSKIGFGMTFVVVVSCCCCCEVMSGEKWSNNQRRKIFRQHNNFSNRHKVCLGFDLVSTMTTL